MTHQLTGRQRAVYVQDMFTRIAGRYDLMNRLMTGWQDIRWRKEVIRRAALPAGGHLLDLGAGTGDLAYEALRQDPACRPVAADFTLAMMQVGKHRQPVDQPFPVWSAADALHLPFHDEAFDTVVSGYLMRNVSDVPLALQEQQRVLRHGGRIVVLDTTPPSKNLFTPLINIHLKYVIPILGRLVTGQADAYAYLPDSTRSFLTAEQLASRMQQAGFQQVGFRRLMFGTIAIHWGQKP
ncbi:MAG: ubiquinone/menaquinone biosynthesis methyltransferase [Anaerolineales bacterium]|jgi:demethylmenaquinone methyltransferase/2-methoxy-6-polyprenyl-1,4-benzoquinol methylase|nr:ubiquinone/menaquinone biosynthesis methyltransferase [Anaerolineales bacterium]